MLLPVFRLVIAATSLISSPLRRLAIVISIPLYFFFFISLLFPLVLTLSAVWACSVLLFIQPRAHRFARLVVICQALDVIRQSRGDIVTFFKSYLLLFGTQVWSLLFSLDSGDVCHPIYWRTWVRPLSGPFKIPLDSYSSAIGAPAVPVVYCRLPSVWKVW